ncbi:chitinase [Legionella beliardensis]|uniref:Chitinase n=2 Tax=Legionella beliardensis TaxID=91822 RepID=A0A378HZE0_9GAMM|nr:chitinase [Legionella beliardensis]
MTLYKIFLVLIACFFSQLLQAVEPPQINKNSLITSTLIPINISYQNECITIFNNTDKSINLNEARIEFYSQAQVTQVAIEEHEGQVILKANDLSTLPHFQGHRYLITFMNLARPLLNPGEQIRVKLNKNSKSPINNLHLLAPPLTPIDVKVSVQNVNWVETFTICNTSSFTIPLTNLEFDFNYALPMPTNIWGNPWVAWTVANQTNSSVTLVGGTPYSGSLAPDPDCKNPLTIQFNANPTSPRPTGPFVFKAAIDNPPAQVGNLTVNLPISPNNALNAPVITVSGSNYSKEQTINWNTSYTFSNLTPGVYTIKGANVTDGISTYTAQPLTANVVANATASATLIYTSQPQTTGTLLITLPVAPAAGLPAPSVDVTGTNYKNQKTLNWGTSWQLTNLTPGNYTIQGSLVTNGTVYYSASAQTAAVKANTTVTQNLIYTQQTATGALKITLKNPPATVMPITFSNGNTSFTQTINLAGQTITLPTGTYNLKSSFFGYDATFNPLTVTIPSNKELTVTYKRATTSNAIYVGYFDSLFKDGQITDGAQTNLANLPSFVNVVNLAFMKPDASYAKSSFDLTTTGLGFNYSGTVLKTAIATLRAKQPTTKILISVGGASYGANWSKLNVDAIANFVTDFGLDGVDIDFEPTNPGCALGADAQIHCAIDTAFQSYVTKLKAALPATAIISVAGWSNGAFGEGSWKQSPPANAYRGIMIPLMRSPAATAINMINVMSYNAGSQYNATDALDAYNQYFKGQVNLGVAVPPEVDSSHVYDLCSVLSLSRQVITKANTNNKAPGLMLWSLQKTPTGDVSHTNPNATLISQVICERLNLFNCDQVLLINGFKKAIPAISLTTLEKLCALQHDNKMGY